MTPIWRRLRCVAAVFILPLAGLSACAGVDDDADIHVVVTTNILGDVATQVLGDQVSVTTLMKPNADPHSFQISAQQATALAEADLIISNGIGLEEGLQQHLDRAVAAGAPLFVAGDAVTVLPYQSDDAAGEPDPHFWTDPSQMIAVVDALEARVKLIDGIDVDTLAATANDYRQQLVALDESMKSSFSTIPPERRALVTNHHVFGYLAHRYGFAVIGAAIPGGTTLAAPSAADLHDLSEAISTANVPAIFAESSQPDRLMQVLAEESGIAVEVVELFTESLTAAGGGAATYIDMMQVNTQRITDSLVG